MVSRLQLGQGYRRRSLARLLGLVSLGCGIMGAAAAGLDQELGLGATAWFLAGGLVALWAIALEVDKYISRP